MIKTKMITGTLALAMAVFCIQSCTSVFNFRSNYRDVNTLIHHTIAQPEKPYLKAHMRNGHVFILQDTWQLDTVENLLLGIGKHYDINRRNVGQGPASIPLDSVVIFETNKKVTNYEKERIAGLIILAGLDIGLGIYCQTVPKACYGSCPTFYMNGDDSFHYSDAEGFSNAVTPSLEYGDVDALNNEMITNMEFSLTMKNEALETHCVKEVKLLAYPRQDGERVYHLASDEFFLCENLYPVSKASGEEGDFTFLLQHEDTEERFSYADQNNLNSREEIFLDFDPTTGQGDLGLILHFRQTLMTTYLLYTGMGYAGDQLSDFMAMMEINQQVRRQFSVFRELGGIEVHLWDETNKRWQPQGTFNETGPIAINKQFIPLDQVSANSRIRLKLVLNKGLWRIDFAALTNRKMQVEPMAILPHQLEYEGEPDAGGLSNINDPGRYLISMPGDKYKLSFRLPEAADYELFVFSKGYYLEWMRQAWYKDKNLLSLRQMIYNPQRFLQREAKNYKLYESMMEEQFWNSKIDTKIISYNEN